MAKITPSYEPIMQGLPAPIKLSAREAAALCALQLNANDSIQQVAKAGRMQSQSLQYILRKFVEGGVLRRSAIINIGRLGLHEYEVALSVTGAQSASERNLFFNKIKNDARMAWCAEVGGHYQYSFSLRAQNVNEVAQYLDELSSLTKISILHKDIVQLVSLEFFRKRYLGTNLNVTPLSVAVDYSAPQVEVDSLDKKILEHLVSGNANSQRDLATVLKMPRATLDYRLRRLRSSKVIERDVFLISARKLGYSAYKALVYGRGSLGQLGEQLQKFAQVNRHVTLLFRTIGSWDYEVGFEVRNPQEARDVILELHSACGGFLADCKIIQILSQSVSDAYLARRA